LQEITENDFDKGSKVRLIPVVGGGEKVESESMGEKVVRACEPDPEELELNRVEFEAAILKDKME
jgi:hypothetical protein